jgi:iron complex transport system permease protein
MTTAVAPAVTTPARHRRRLSLGWLAVGFGAVLVASVLGLVLGPISLPPADVLAELLDRLPFVDIDSALNDREAAIVWELRFPRVVLGLLVGAMLSVSGGSYQGVFRNPLADPYLLGAAAGAGLGATLAIVNEASSGVVPLAAFVGALGAVALAYTMGAAGDRLRSPATLLLAGVAVASFLTAIQTFVLQRNTDDIRAVYSWILGRLSTAGWGEVRTAFPYFIVTAIVLLACRRALDVLAVGDEEATSLGLRPERIRLIVVLSASLATAAAVSVSGLIGFVGIIVPHTVRLLAGHSYRVVLPLSILFGGAFLALTDLIARTALAPSELPIGVVTAFFGAPFFVLVLRNRRTAVT